METSYDMRLLHQYATSKSEAAFAELVSRHIGLVYSSALRQTGNPHLAEEITQVVFIILARKAGSIRNGTILAGWLFRTTRFAANDALKKEIRRQRREQEAHMQSMLDESESEPHWQQVSPLLDEAIAELGDKDRNALLLRFFEKKSFNDVGSTLGINEETAKKRVSRAVEKLRKFFTKRGTILPTATLIGVLSANSVAAAPIGLASTVAASAAIKGVVASGTTLSLLKGTLELMAWAKAKTAAIATAGVLLAATTAQVAVEHFSEPRFEKAYGLSRGEDLKHIAPPFIPERLEFFQNDPGTASLARSMKDLPVVMIVEQNGRNLEFLDATWGGFDNDFSSVICDVLKIRRPHLEGPDELLDMTLNGDWTIRSGTSQEKLARALEAIVSKERKRKIYIQRSMADRPVVVIRGNLKTGQSPVDVYVSQKERDSLGNASGPLSKFADSMANWVNVPFVNEASIPSASAQFRWVYHRDSTIHGMKNRRTGLDTLLKNLAAQTGLSFSRENRRIEIWTVSQEFNEAAWFDPEALARTPATVILRSTKFPDDQWGGFWVPEEKMCGRAMTPLQLMGYAHNHWQSRIVSEVPWPEGRFDFMATLSDDDENREALQKKISEKLGIVARHETRRVPSFLLKVADANAAGLIPSKNSSEGRDYKHGYLSATNESMNQLRGTLEFYLKTPVIDQTGLEENFDFDLRWTHTPAEDSRFPVQTPNVTGLKEALRAQLGLELVSSEQQIEMLIVERAQN